MVSEPFRTNDAPYATTRAPATPDNIPVVGATGVEGLLMATGHYRNGILLAPLTARTIADLSEGATVTGPMTGADPSRFKDRDLAVTG